MHIVTLLGSPRRDGNTAHVLGWAEEAFRDAGHTVERITIIDHQIGPCVECLSCRKSSGRCAMHRDDANSVLERIGQADALVLASPVFCWGFPSHTKALLDRMYALVENYDINPEYTTRLANKPMGLILTCGGPEEGNAELVIRAFYAMVNFMKAVPRGHLLYPFFRRVEELTVVDRKRAIEFAARMTAAETSEVS